MTLKPEHIVEELNRTPKLKRDLIMKMVEVMLDSEAFLEAYPRLYDPALAEVSSEYREKVREELAQIIVRLFRKNKVRMDDASDVLYRARRYYLEMYVNRDKPKGEREYERKGKDVERRDRQGTVPEPGGQGLSGRSGAGHEAGKGCGAGGRTARNGVHGGEFSPVRVPAVQTELPRRQGGRGQ